MTPWAEVADVATDDLHRERFDGLAGFSKVQSHCIFWEGPADQQPSTLYNENTLYKTFPTAAELLLGLWLVATGQVEEHRYNQDAWIFHGHEMISNPRGN